MSHGGNSLNGAERSTCIDVCVATYRRPDMLRGLLRSLFDQVPDSRFSMRVFVVDNDPHEGARSIVEDFADRGLPVSYLVQPTRDLARTRNEALQAGTGQFAAFVDDDEQVSPRWLSELLSSLESTGADIAHGPAYPRFHPETHPFFLQRELFYGPNPPSGLDRRFVPATNNCLIRREVLARTDHLFDSRFGTTGGEDTEFFRRLASLGARSVWCREAWVEEQVPPDRCRVGWIALRAFRCGILHTEIRRLHRDKRTGQQVAIRGALAALEVAALPLSVALVPLTFTPARILLRSLPFNLGVVVSLTGVSIDGYK